MVFGFDFFVKGKGLFNKVRSSWRRGGLLGRRFLNVLRCLEISEVRFLFYSRIS